MWGEIVLENVLEKIKNLTKKQRIIIASVAGVLVITTIVVLLFVFSKPEKETKPAIESIKIEQPKKKEKEKKKEEAEEANQKRKKRKLFRKKKQIHKNQ